ncbi:hypothetical protein [Hymenobacter algoricola]|uniref:Uncharacterized protein n=1 Tax=Hymenobacter algoricola TaxID=486267 RepID=A0ABP7NW95_9BACT
MKSLYLFAGLLLGSAPAFAQEEKNISSADAKGPAAVSVTALPGEEKLSVRERAERDFLMPVRRKQDAALRAAHEEAQQQATAEASFVGPKEPEVEEAAAPAAKPAVRRTYHRASSAHRRASSKRKATSKSGTAKKKVVHKTSRR